MKRCHWPALCLAIGSLAGCGELPGEVVGTYRITNTLEENTCGEHAVYRLDMKRYSAQLRSEGTIGYWRVPGQTPLRGKYDAPDFRFEYGSIVAMGDPDAGPRRCRLLQREVLTGSVKVETGDETDEGEGEEEEPSLEGEHELTISAEPGSDCQSALAPAGAFEELPCKVRYALRGVDTKPF